MKGCIFCQIKLHDRLFYEDDLIVIVPFDPSDNTDSHVVIMSREHLNGIENIDSDNVHIIHHMKHVANSRYSSNIHTDGFQHRLFRSVNHLHMHVVRNKTFNLLERILYTHMSTDVILANNVFVF